MRTTILLLMFTISTSLNAQKDSIAIVELLKADYATMGNWDLKSHLGNITSDYLLLEHGEIWDIKMETDSIYIKFAKRVMTRKDFFTFRSVKVFDNIAYAVYELRSDFTENDKSFFREWVESAVFRKENGQWKIAMVHSTRINPK